MFYELKLNYMTKERGGALAVFLALPIFQGLARRVSLQLLSIHTIRWTHCINLH